MSEWYLHVMKSEGEHIFSSLRIRISSLSPNLKYLSPETTKCDRVDFPRFETTNDRIITKSVSLFKLKNVIWVWKALSSFQVNPMTCWSIKSEVSEESTYGVDWWKMHVVEQRTHIVFTWVQQRQIPSRAWNSSVGEIRSWQGPFACACHKLRAVGVTWHR